MFKMRIGIFIGVAYGEDAIRQFIGRLISLTQGIQWLAIGDSMLNTEFTGFNFPKVILCIKILYNSEATNNVYCLSFKNMFYERILRIKFLKDKIV
ncbi:MAG: hypothetical protein RXR39_03905 [Caldivirga sp.]